MKVNGFDWKGKKVLVTGASGFKGSWLSSTLLKLGATVYGTVREKKSPISAYSLLNLNERIVKITADITNRQQVYDLVNSTVPDVIFHLAAIAIVPVAKRDPRRTFNVNIMGTLNIIEATRRLKVGERLLICSTDHVFGNVQENKISKEGLKETERVSYGAPYDTSKAAMELAVRSYYYTYWNELPSIGITRCANVFGGGDVAPRRVIPLFVQSALEDGKIPLRYRFNGRKFIHVTDAISGYIRAASSLNDGNLQAKSKQQKPQGRTPFTPTFHFSIEKYDGTDKPYIQMFSLAEIVSDLFGAEIDDSNCVAYAPDENKYQALNCQRTKEKLNWNTQKGLREAIEELGRWYSSLDTPKKLSEMLEEDIQSIVSNLEQ